MLGNLDVVQILRVGLAGLCFLLSLLAFWLIQREQQREGDPRHGILRAIYAFMVINLLAALLVYFGQRQKTAAASGELTSDDYLVDYTSYLFDATKWTPSTTAVYVTRSDFIRKVSASKKDFIIHYYTTGTKITWESLATTQSIQPTFDGPWQEPGDQKMHYDYHLQIGNEPTNWFGLVSSRFTFLDGFKDAQHEWWLANVAYPARTLSVVFRFPSDKHAKTLKVSNIVGENRQVPITDNPAVSSDGGYTEIWVGVNLEARTRIRFDWDW